MARTASVGEKTELGEKFEIAVSNIVVGKKHYSFDYVIYRTRLNGHLERNEGKYDGSHSRAPQTMRKYLREGGAVELALDRI